MAKKTKEKSLRETIVQILETADQKEELFNQTTDKIIDLIYDEMKRLHRSLQANKDKILLDAATDVFLDQYIHQRYYNKVEQGPVKKSVTRTDVKIAAIDNSLCVVLQSEGNPDFKQYAPVSPKQVMPVETMTQAAEACTKYIEEYDLGMGNWTGGQIYHPTKGLIATVGYNGRVWKGDFNDFEKQPEEYPAELLTKKWNEL